MTPIAGFLGLIALWLTGAPVFAAPGLTASAIQLLAEGGINALDEAVYAHLHKPILSTIALFVLMAQVMIHAKVIDALCDFAHTVIADVKGGLGVATVLACTIFAAIFGSSVATALSIGLSAIPQITRFGFPERDALGVAAAGWMPGILIPPSGPIILNTIMSEASIGALFLAGVIPGLLLALMFSVFCMVQARARKRVASRKWAGWSLAGGALRRSIWARPAPPMAMGGIYFGVFTAPEAAAGSLHALPVAAPVYGKFGLRDLRACAVATMRTSMMVFMIIAGAMMLGHAMTLIRL